MTAPTLLPSQLAQLRRMAGKGDTRAIHTLEEIGLRLPATPAPRPININISPQVATLNPVALEVIRRAKLPEPQPEHQFLDGRKFAFDFAWPQHKVALEAEGMVHRTKDRFARDLEKYNAALELGWKVFRASRRILEQPDTLIRQLRSALEHQETPRAEPR
jgi:very-short-patch-repair endonuclease